MAHVLPRYFYRSTAIEQIVCFYVKSKLPILFILPLIREICICSVTDFEFLVKFHEGTLCISTA
jgi:hypothetical protein